MPSLDAVSHGILDEADFDPARAGANCHRDFKKAEEPCPTLDKLIKTPRNREAQTRCLTARAVARP